MTKVNNYKIYKWRDIKANAEKLNPPLAALLNTLPGVDDFEVLEASYAFGENVLKNGQWYFPANGKVTPFESADIPQSVRALLDYNWVASPFGMVIENSLESHIRLPSHLAPARLLTPGGSYGLMTLLEDGNEPYLLYTAYTMKAGCRSLLALPKLSHKQYCDRLAKKYPIDDALLCPKTFDQQWPFFRALAHAPNFDQSWQAKVLYFSKPFGQAIEKEIHFKAALLSSAWRSSSFLRSEFSYNVLWSVFINEHASLAVRNTANIVHTAKQLLHVALGQAPAFTPAIDDTPGPILGFSRALLDVYKIRYYHPTFMQLGAYDTKQPLYYSLQRPGFLNRIPDKSSGNQTINEIKLVANLWDQFKNHVLEDRFPFTLKGTQLYKMLETTTCEFYHPQGDENLYSDINTIFKTDQRFDIIPKKLNTKKQLRHPENSMFFNGCIKISPKNL